MPALTALGRVCRSVHYVLDPDGYFEDARRSGADPACLDTVWGRFFITTSARGKKEVFAAAPDLFLVGGGMEAPEPVMFHSSADLTITPLAHRS